MNYVPLRVHSEFAVTDGLCRLPLLARVCEQYKLPACAITDTANLFAAVKAYKAFAKNGVQPIIGSELSIITEHGDAPEKATFLCQNVTGYHNLCRLISKGYVEGERDHAPLYERSWLKSHSEGLIVLAGADSPEVDRAVQQDDSAQLKAWIDNWQQTFGNYFYADIQRVGRPSESARNYQLMSAAYDRNCSAVATNSVMFIYPGDFDAHEARSCISGGWTLDQKDRPKRYTTQQFLKTPEQMAEDYKDCPELLSNTIKIAQQCCFHMDLGKPVFPKFPVPEGQTIDTHLIQESRLGLQDRLNALFISADDRQAKELEYTERLEEELKIIIEMGFAGYFLIVSDFIRWAIENHIPVGPGRGSGAGSIVAYSLFITNIDPITYDLLFERFLNPERVSLPDFDIDFCMEGRDKVIDYVTQKYGSSNVSQIVTFGTMAAKAVVRDVGRVLGFPYGFVDKIAKLIPFEIGMTLDKAMEDEPRLQELYETEEEVTELIDLAKKLEGLVRNVGKHAGGVVIAPSHLTEFAPIYTESIGANPVIQFDKDDAETAGLIKFDFLGLRTLTIIDWAVQAINAAHPDMKPVDINTIDIVDPKVFKLLQACCTTAVFQLESRGMKDLIKRLRPDDFEQIIALVALFRPGPLQSGMVDDYIERKHARAKVQYLHPALKEVLMPTYGVILYQEQVMQIAQELAGYTLGGADLLRRAMGKKKPEEMAKQREIFTDGAVENNVDEEIAQQIFDLMEKFAGYGFNKSHSAAYALVSYQTAWLKTHFPAYFMAAVLSADMSHTDKVLIMVKECKSMKIRMRPPCINKSHYKFQVESQQEIRYGLGAIKGVGENIIEEIINCRGEDDGFTDLADFFDKVQHVKLNKRTMEALIRSGSLKALHPNSAELLANLEILIKFSQQLGSQSLSGQKELFEATSVTLPQLTPTLEMSMMQILESEKATLGLYLSGHPMTLYADELRPIVNCSLGKLKRTHKKVVMIAGFVQAIRKLTTKRGDKMAIITIDDGVTDMELPAFSDLYEQHQHWLSDNVLVIAEVGITRDERKGELRIRPKQFYSLSCARAQLVNAVLVRIDPTQQPDFKALLDAVLKSHNEDAICPVWIEYIGKENKILLKLGSEWAVTPNESLISDLESTFGADNVKLHYKRQKLMQNGEKTA